MNDIILARNCAPTLAGIKTGSLFGYYFTSVSDLNRIIGEWNSILNPKGVFVKILSKNSRRALIYTYRKTRLERDLSDKDALSLLMSYGYTDFSLEGLLDKLSERISLSKDGFPHEIGLFLGYPLSDVKGFIDNKGKNFKLVGQWKVYGDENRARRTFDCYNKCTDFCCRHISCGGCLMKITASA